MISMDEPRARLKTVRMAAIRQSPEQISKRMGGRVAHERRVSLTVSDEMLGGYKGE